MRHTQHLDNCMGKIAATPELREDSLIRPYILLEMFASRLIDHFGYSQMAGFAPKGDRAVYFSAESLIQELEQTKAAFIEDVADYSKSPVSNPTRLSQCVG